MNAVGLAPGSLASTRTALLQPLARNMIIMPRRAPLELNWIARHIILVNLFSTIDPIITAPAKEERSITLSSSQDFLQPGLQSLFDR